MICPIKVNLNHKIIANRSISSSDCPHAQACDSGTHIFVVSC